MSHLPPLSEEYFDYFTFLNKSITSEDKKAPCSLSTKQSSPSSQFNSRTHRLKCFTEFSNSPEVNEQAFDSNKSNINKISQEEWNDKLRKENKSYEFTYKILFNLGSNKKEQHDQNNNLKQCASSSKPFFEATANENNNGVMQNKLQQQFCLCSMDQSENPTRNIKIIEPYLNLDSFLGFAQNFGEVSNVDLCDFPRSLVVSFFDLNSAAQYANSLASQNIKSCSDLCFISSLNETAFFDYIIVKELFESKNADFESVFSLFGQTYEINYLSKCVMVKYSNLKSIQKLEKCLENFHTDPKAQLKFLKNIFLNIPEDFMRNILSKVLLPSNKENYTSIFMNLGSNSSFSTQNDFPDYGNFNEQEKENCPPNMIYNNMNTNNKKKPLKLTSSVFSLSEISSVNDANNQINNNKFGENGNGSKYNFTIDLDLIKQGLEKRTTIMIRNIPNRYNQESLLRVIDVKFKGMYDFLYLPMDFKNKCNIGYAFVNFISTKCILDFYLEFHNKRWDLLRSEKICCVCYARIQGRNQLIKHFKKSNVIHMPLDKNYKPLILPNPALDSQMLQIHSFD